MKLFSAIRNVRDPLKSITLFLFYSIAPVVVALPRAMPVLIILLAAVATVRLLRDGGAAALLPRDRVITSLVFALLCLAAVGSTWSDSWRAVSATAEATYIAFGAFVIARLVAALDADEARRVRRAVLVGTALGLAIWTFDILLDHPVHRLIGDVPENASALNTNIPKRTAAAIVLLMWPVLAYLPASRRNRIIVVGVLILLTYLTVLANSRSALFGAAFGFVVFLLARRAANATRFVLMGVVVATLLSVVPVSRYLAEDAGLITAPWLFSSARSRVEIWERAAKRYFDAPYLGHGIDASREMRSRPGDTSAFNDDLSVHLFPLHPHNSFIQIWLELGAVGAILVAAILLWMSRVIGRLPPSIHPFALAQFASGVFMANTAYGVWQAWWMASYLAGGILMAAVVRFRAISPHDEGASSSGG